MPLPTAAAFSPAAHREDGDVVFEEYESEGEEGEYVEGDEHEHDDGEEGALEQEEVDEDAAVLGGDVEGVEEYDSQDEEGEEIEGDEGAWDGMGRLGA